MPDPSVLTDDTDLYTVMFNPGPDWFERQTQFEPARRLDPNDYPAACAHVATPAAAIDWIRRQRGQYPDPEYYVVASRIDDQEKRDAARTAGGFVWAGPREGDR